MKTLTKNQAIEQALNHLLEIANSCINQSNEYDAVMEDYDMLFNEKENIEIINTKEDYILRIIGDPHVYYSYDNSLVEII